MRQRHDKPAVSIHITGEVQGWEVGREMSKDEISLIFVSIGRVLVHKLVWSFNKCSEAQHLVGTMPDTGERAETRTDQDSCLPVLQLLFS